MSIVSNFAFPIIGKDAEEIHALRALFEVAGVETRPIIAGDISVQPFWKKHVGTIHDNSTSKHIHEAGFYIGNNPELTKKEIALLVRLLSGK
jgi:CDP-6-deoxy-D-xylo-4-hexulose-3-dehydrase